MRVWRNDTAVKTDTNNFDLRAAAHQLINTYKASMPPACALDRAAYGDLPLPRMRAAQRAFANLGSSTLPVWRRRATGDVMKRHCTEGLPCFRH